MNTPSTRIWSNWSGDIHFELFTTVVPAGEQELQQVVQQAVDKQQTVRTIDAAHSCSAIVVTDQVLVVPAHFKGLHAYDAQAGWATVDRHRHQVAWRVLYRPIAADDASLSNAYGKDIVAITIHQHATLPYREYFDDIEKILQSYGGRPHWVNTRVDTSQGHLTFSTTLAFAVNT